MKVSVHQLSHWALVILIMFNPESIVPFITLIKNYKCLTYRDFFDVRPTFKIKFKEILKPVENNHL